MCVREATVSEQQLEGGQAAAVELGMRARAKEETNDLNGMKMRDEKTIVQARATGEEEKERDLLHTWKERIAQK